MSYVLILYYSKKGATSHMAQHIARGVDQSSKIKAKIRTVPPILENARVFSNNIPKEGPLYATVDDVRNCRGIILGSPAYFGNIAAPLKHFMDSLTPIWLEGALIDKPAAVFTSSSSLHGGQESTLLNMMTMLLHQGLLVVGLPYSEKELTITRSGGTPYGPSQFSGEQHQLSMTEEEKQLCMKIGKRVATLALQLTPETSGE